MSDWMEKVGTINRDRVAFGLGIKIVYVLK